MNNIKKLFRGIFIKFRQIDWEGLKWSNLDKTKILVPFSLFAHPIETFNDIKYEKRGSLAIANIMLVILFLEEIANYFFVGFLFSNNEPSQFSLVPILLKTVVIVLLWCVTNWAMCTLLEGDGTFKDIWLATCYSLLPLILFRLPLGIISNALTVSESAIYTTISSVVLGWSLLLVFLGMMVVHQFTVTKTIGSVILSLAMIVILAFLVLLGFSIFQQMWAFAKTIVTEILRR